MWCGSPQNELHVVGIPKYVKYYFGGSFGE